MTAGIEYVPVGSSHKAWSAGQVITGDVLSTTVITWDWLVEFPQSSVAVHVRVNVADPAHDPTTETSSRMTGTLVSHKSVAVTAAAAGMASQLTVTPAGTPISVGAVWSTIRTVEGDMAQGESVVAVPAGMGPQADANTYRVRIEYPAQLSAVGGVFGPQLMPSSKLYSMSNPVSGSGGVTTIGPQPAFTTGAEAAGGKITTYTVLLSTQDPWPEVPAGKVPHADSVTYLADTV